jgi:serine/threonine-protein kinase
MMVITMAHQADRDPVVKIGDVVEGRYRIIKTLGEGGMGTVFLAEHALIKRRVAMKILHPELATDADVIERFMNEARAAGTLGHPNIVESTDMGFTHNHVPYIVFEYLEGTLLTDEIYRVGGLSVRRAVRIAQQIASALHAAHNAEIVHRDLKSDNIFLTDKDDALDHVKVLDFGISRFLATEDEQTRRGMVMGTPEFMAPEQIHSPQLVDKRADIYALGVMLYEMLTARRPFSNDEDPRDLLHRIVHDEPPPLQRTEVPHALDHLIMTRLLAKSPDDRYQTMMDVEAALDAFTTQDGLPRSRRSRPMAAAHVDDPARRSATIPRPAQMSDTPWPPSERPSDLALQAVTLPTVSSRRSWALYGVAVAGLVVGGVGLMVGTRGTSSEPVAHVTPVVPPAPLPAASVPAPTPAREAKVDVQLESNVANARVTFRRRVSPTPAAMQITPSDIVELVEVSAPGHKTVRYWLTFDRPTHLTAQLVKGEGLVEASEEQTLVALGEVAAPSVVAAAAPVVRAPLPAPAAAVTQATPVAMTVAKPVEAPADTKVTPVVPAAPAAPAAPRRIGHGEDVPRAELATVADPVVPETTPTPAKPAIEMGVVSAVVSQHRLEVVKCFAEGKKASAAMKGTLTLQLQVDVSGKVKRVQVQSTLKNPLVAACVVKSATVWHFPARATGELATVAYPFVLN